MIQPPTGYVSVTEIFEEISSRKKTRSDWVFGPEENFFDVEMIERLSPYGPHTAADLHKAFQESCEAESWFFTQLLLSIVPGLIAKPLGLDPEPIHLWEHAARSSWPDTHFANMATGKVCWNEDALYARDKTQEDDLRKLKEQVLLLEGATIFAPESALEAVKVYVGANENDQTSNEQGVHPSLAGPELVKELARLFLEASKEELALMGPAKGAKFLEKFGKQASRSTIQRAIMLTRNATKWS